MLERVLSWLSETSIRRLYNSCRDLLNPIPSPLVVHGNDDVAQACRLMLSYGCADDSESGDESQTKLCVAENDIVDTFEMLVFAGYISMCIPVQPLFAARILAKLRELMSSDVETVTAYVLAKTASDTWLQGANAPTVLDFYAAAVLYETDDSVAASFVDELMAFADVSFFEEQSEEESE